LITFMLQFNPTHRLSIEEVKAHPWYNGVVPNHEQIQKEFVKRKQRVDKEALIQHQQKMQQKSAAQGHKVFKGDFRDD